MHSAFPKVKDFEGHWPFMFAITVALKSKSQNAQKKEYRLAKKGAETAGRKSIGWPAI